MADTVVTLITQAQSLLTQTQTVLTAALAAANNPPVPPIPPVPPTLPTGVTRYSVRSTSAWDPILNTTDPALQATVRSDLNRLASFTPFFDPKLSWFPDAWVYFDSYAIYNPSALATQHPEWILTDMQGNKLYIPWGCANGTCPQYAGDIGNPLFRANQIGQMKQFLAAGGSTPAGYKGLWLDDINLNLSVGNGSGANVRPLDPRTRLPMTDSDWRRYFAEYMELVRQSFPSTEIVHNCLWFVERDLPGDPYIKRQFLAADFINIERGFGDDGIGGGTGPWSLSALMNYCDFAHSLSRPVVIEDFLMANQHYSLACYYLIQTGKDFFGTSELLPASWTPNLKLNLGTATAPRYRWTGWNGLWRRDFASGMALALEPGAPNATPTLPSTMYDEAGNPVNTVTLKAKGGMLLRYSK